MSETNNLIQAISPDHYERFKRWKKINTYSSILLLISLAIASGYQCYKIVLIKKLLKENAPLEQHHLHLQTSIRNAQASIEQLTKKLAAIEPLQQAGSLLLTHLEQLGSTMEPDIKISSYQQDLQTICLQGESGTLQSVMSLNHNLHNIPFFSAIQLHSIKPTMDGQQKLYHFSMNCSRSNQ